MQYNVFHRTWWQEAERPGWPNNLEPQAGKKNYLVKNVTYERARELCSKWNANNRPGRYSDKAEFEQA